MKTLQWLLRREYWENKAMLLWTPLVVAVMIIIGAISIANKLVTSQKVVLFQNNLSGLTPKMQQILENIVTANYVFMTLPFFGLMAIMTFFYCLGSLHDERKDRSILFWKSLPVSDGLTVSSKMLITVVAFPVITLAVSLLTSMVVMTVLGIGMLIKGVNLFGMVLSMPALYLVPLQLIALLPVYFIWALPTVGWLMFVSSAAPGRPFLWAIGIPLLFNLLLVLANKVLDLNIDIKWVSEYFLKPAYLGMLPGGWLFVNPDNMQTIQDLGGREMRMDVLVSLSWQALASLRIWLEAAVGLVLLYVSTRLRHYRSEI